VGRPRTGRRSTAIDRATADASREAALSACRLRNLSPSPPTAPSSANWLATGTCPTRSASSSTRNTPPGLYAQAARDVERLRNSARTSRPRRSPTKRPRRAHRPMPQAVGHIGLAASVSGSSISAVRTEQTAYPFRRVAFSHVRGLGAGERIRTADRPLTRSIALSAVQTCENGSH
jgi:hypothetical protein